MPDAARNGIFERTRSFFWRNLVLKSGATRRRQAALLVIAYLSVTADDCSCNNTITDIVGVSVTAQGSTTLRAGETVDLLATATNQNGNSVSSAEYNWSSSNVGVATVAELMPDRNARVTAVGAGTVEIRALEPNHSASGVITLTIQPPALSSIRVLPASPTVQPGGSLTLTAEAVRQSNGSTVAVPFEWTSSNPSVATVTWDPATSSQATVLGVTPGTTTITAVEPTQPGVLGTTTVTVMGPVLRAFVTGTMYAADGTTPLAGMWVGVSGFPSTTSSSNGQYTIEVTPGGNLELFAQGVCDLVHACNHELTYNSSDLEPVTVAPGETKVFNLSARRGYHLEITGGARDTAVLPGASFQRRLDYRAWNRFNRPGAVPRLTPGVEENPGPSLYIEPQTLTPGVYPGVTRTANVTLAAPSSPGEYGVYVHLTRTSDANQALDVYRTVFSNLVTRDLEMIRVFTLKVCATAPNC